MQKCGHASLGPGRWASRLRWHLMANSTTKRRVVRHILSIICSTGFLAAMPFTLYCAWVIPPAVSAADLGGPLNFVIIPLMGGIVGAVISVVGFLPLSLLAERFSFPRWLQAVGASAALLTLILISVWIYGGAPNAAPPWAGWLVLGTSICLYAVGGFFAYLCCLAVCRRVFP